nr:myelin-associated glycoprotein-like [Pseudochaenichthys georgianus]
MDLKLLFPFLILHVIHDVHSSSNQWTVTVPEKISVLQGSCVVIPCLYNYPMPKSKKPLTSWSGFWLNGKKFLGNLAARNCSMLLDSVGKNDVGPFHFRIEMRQYKSFSYSKNPVTLEVTSDPQPPVMSVVMNKKVTASCSVSHSCPVIPPRFSWSHPGNILRRSKKLNTWKWETVSTLTFSPRISDFNKPLNCTVHYRGGKKVTSSTIIKT